MTGDNRGSLIVFEGTDASGKTTMARMLCEYFSSIGIPHSYKKILSKAAAHEESIYGEHLQYMDGLFLSMPDIRYLMDKGINIVHDRYIDSLDVFRECVIKNVDQEISEKCKEHIKELFQLINPVKPTLSFYLSVDFHEALNRKKVRSKSDELVLSNEEIFNNQKKMYNSISEQNGGILINTTHKNIDEVFGIIKKNVGTILTIDKEGFVIR